MSPTSKPINKRIWQDIIVYGLMLGFYLLYFRLICNSGMSADDMWNSNVWSSTYTGQDKAWYVVMHQMPVWLHMGRFFPFSNLAPVIYMMVPSVFRYKLAIVLATYLDNLVCSLCVRKMTGERLFGYVYILLFPVLIQLTPEFDSGLYCYHMLIQSVVLFGFLSVLGLQLYMETHHKRYAVLSAVSFFVALGTYEVGFVFIFLLIYVAWSGVYGIEPAGQERSGAKGNQNSGRFKKLILCLLPDLIVFVLMCAMNVLVRVFFQTATYDGIAVKLDPVAVIRTLLKQCSTCIPLGRYICAGLREVYPYSEVYTYSLSELISRITFMDILTVVLYIILFVWLVRRLLQENSDSHITRRNAVVLIISGLIIWIIPGGLIAISSKYQQILAWCSGHLPAYMQSLGFAMLVAGIYILVLTCIRSGRGRWVLTWTLGALSMLIVLVSQVAGRDAVEFMNGFRKYPQANVGYAADAGIFDDLVDREDRVIVGTTCYIYDMSSSRQFYTKFARKNLYACERQGFLDSILGEGSEVPYRENEDATCTTYDLTRMDQEYYGVFNMADKNSGALILGRYVELDYNPGNQTVEHLWIADPVIYIRGDGMEMSGVDSSDWTLIEDGDDYEIYQLSGKVDILQEPEYYELEFVSDDAVLYRR